jgi:hypothetical protein
MNNDLKAMTDAQLDAEAKALRGMAYTASQARKAGAFGRIDRRLDAVYREQDSRRKRAR